MTDFSIMAKVAGLPLSDTDGKRRKLPGQDESGELREYLRPYETVPVQLLNCYGEASYNKMNDAACWKNMVMPQRSGAAFMTEMASLDTDRRGVGMNRASQHESVYDYDITPKDWQTPIAKRQTAAAGPMEEN